MQIFIKLIESFIAEKLMTEEELMKKVKELVSLIKSVNNMIYSEKFLSYLQKLPVSHPFKALYCYQHQVKFESEAGWRMHLLECSDVESMNFRRYLIC